VAREAIAETKPEAIMSEVVISLGNAALG